MSWLFGINTGQGNPPQYPVPPSPPPPGGDDKGSGSKGGDGGKGISKMDAYRFDSAALERAAKAAKDLETSSTNTILFIYLLHNKCQPINIICFLISCVT